MSPTSIIARSLRRALLPATKPSWTPHLVSPAAARDCFFAMPPRRSPRNASSESLAIDGPTPEEARPAKKPRVSSAPESPQPSPEKKGPKKPASKESAEPAKSVRRKKDMDSDCPSAPTAAFYEKYGENLAAEGLPRISLDLTTLPEPYNGPEALEKMAIRPRIDGDTRIVVWNIVSFRSSDKKGMFSYLKAEDADIVVLLETKVNEAPTMHAGFTRWPHRYWAIDSSKKGYAGVAVWSKIKPVKATIGIPASVIGAHATADDTEGASSESKGKLYDGRVVTLEMKRHYLVGYYAPNAGEGLKRIEGKVQWFDDLIRWLQYLQRQQPSKPIIMTGDLNVVLDERDVSVGRTKWNKSPGFTHAECSNWRRMVQPPPASDTLPSSDNTETDEKPHKVYSVPANAEMDAPFPFIDVWRQLHPDAVGHFSFFGNRGGCRPKGIGWRLDSFLVSSQQYEHVKETEPTPVYSTPKVPIRSCEIRYNVYGTSDHVPVVLDVADQL